MPRKRDAIRRDDQRIHVISRGVDRNVIFRRAKDFLEYTNLMQENLRKFEVRLEGYSLMPNHSHIMLWQRFAYEVSRFMQQVNGRYAQLFNGRYGRTGHLFQGRFKADPVDGPASMLRLSWYIHQNPVAARLVKSPERWEFSSMKAYAGLTAGDMVTTEILLNLVGGRENYRAFMRDYDPLDPGSAWEYLL